MCDYSLCGLPTRLAIEGEELIVHKFRTGSYGLASPEELKPVERPHDPPKGFWQWIKGIFEEPPEPPAGTAVCIPPGAQLILRNIPEDLARRWMVGDEESVFFVQISADENNYRDAVRFANGQEILLQHLREGIPVHVVSLGNAYADSEKDFAIPLA